ncbi:hypothetical protein EYF80_001082 [Liparis tanakae]|uniref:Uncharacterized protein n=1 Tax=Liparis tanakae TaxID=230148 RepID=A0A4Z2JEZ3_9TELE|nr:hypothetical protein EYF80_001082 [Liparis tanakae]
MSSAIYLLSMGPALRREKSLREGMGTALATSLVSSRSCWYRADRLTRIPRKITLKKHKDGRFREPLLKGYAKALLQRLNVQLISWPAPSTLRQSHSSHRQVLRQPPKILTPLQMGMRLCRRMQGERQADDTLHCILGFITQLPG